MFIKLLLKINSLKKDNNNKRVLIENNLQVLEWLN